MEESGRFHASTLYPRGKTSRYQLPRTATERQSCSPRCLACGFHVTLMMDAASTFETSVDQTTALGYTSEDSHLHTRSRENLSMYLAEACYQNTVAFVCEHSTETTGCRAVTFFVSFNYHRCCIMSGQNGCKAWDASVCSSSGRWRK
jgi:hypothetical protein